MNWDDVRVFLAVARAGQFVAAARALKVDHATAARRVTALERALNARLVDRRTTGVLLTEAGARFLAAAERMETACLQAQAELGDRDVELSGTVRIGAPDGLSTYYLAGSSRPWRSAIPPSRSSSCRPRRPGPWAGARSTSRWCWRSRRRGASWRASSPTIRSGSSPRPTTSPATRRRATPRTSPRTASSATSRSSTIRRRWATWRSCAGTRRSRFQCAGAIGQLEAVRAGVGIGVLHDFIARRHPDLVRVLPERRARRSYWIVEHEDTRGIGRIRAVHDALVEAAARDRAIFIAR